MGIDGGTGTGWKVEPEVCDCACHSNTNIKHMRPCCYSCVVCTKLIRDAFFVNHVRNCVAETPKNKKGPARIHHIE